MPTGYTSAVCDGTELEMNKFIMRIATAFFPAYRDNGKTHLDINDNPISLDDVTYYSKKYSDAINEYNKLSKLSEKELEDMYIEYKTDNNTHYTNSRNKITKMKNNYECMLSQLNNWKPKSDIGKNIKKYAIEQLEQSLKFDCYDVPEPHINEFSEWKVNYIKNINDNIKYYNNQLNAAIIKYGNAYKVLNDLIEDITKNEG